MTVQPSPLEFAAGLTRGEPFPSRRVEGWRWSDLQRVLRALPPESPPAAIAAGAGPFHGLAEDEIAFWNGRGPVGEARIDRDLIVRFITDAQGTGHEARLRLAVPAGVKATLFETYEGYGAGYFANTLIEIELGEDAQLERIVQLDEPADAVSLSTAEVRLSKGALFSQTVLASGARLQRHETHVRHPGQRAAVRLDGVYVLDGARHADFTTSVTHAAMDGTTSQLTKGVVRDEARGVFQGRISVLPGADATDARMGHHALVLSDRAEVNAKPELEIWADDVSCAHGATVGSLDEEALFYIRSRGLPEADARALLIEAFLGQVADRIEHPGAQEAARVWLQRRLYG